MSADCAKERGPAGSYGRRVEECKVKGLEGMRGTAGGDLGIGGSRRRRGWSGAGVGEAHCSS